MNALRATLRVPLLLDRFIDPGDDDQKRFVQFLRSGFFRSELQAGCQLIWVFVHNLGKIAGNRDDYDEQGRSWIDEWLLGHIMHKTLQELGFNPDDISQGILAVKIFTGHQHWYGGGQSDDLQSGGICRGAYQALETFLNDSEVQRFLQINRYMDILWFSKEAFELLLTWMAFTAMVNISVDAARTEDEQHVSLTACCKVLSELYEASNNSGYQVEKLVEIVRQDDTAKPREK
ncbi:MAG: hypothetical protein A4E64_00508 [Syntrophorhabdus sp. PtaU1.Bin058]|nr:MAG: hypothetical protein A4E64_00508 [Syntrophorhabdus sp. PtaU1.Bin058]